MLTYREYAAFCSSIDVTPPEHAPGYHGLGLVGEVAEYWDANCQDDAVKELGDVIWYTVRLVELSQTAHEVFPNTSRNDSVGARIVDGIGVLALTPSDRDTLMIAACNVAQDIKRFLRDGEWPEAFLSNMQVLWLSIGATCNMLLAKEDEETPDFLTLAERVDEVVTINHEKLTGRKDRGTLHGVGDNR